MLKVELGFYAILAIVLVWSGGIQNIPWTVPLLLLGGVRVWRRRAHLDRISTNPELLADDRRSRLLMGCGVIVFVSGFLVIGVSPAANEPEMVFVLGFAAVIAGAGLLAYRAFASL